MKKINISQNFKQNIKMLRIVHGETQKELGNAIGVANNTISQYEKFGDRLPDIEITAQLAEHFNTSIDQLLTGKINKINPKFDDLDPWSYIEDMFPLVESETALKNDSFREAMEGTEKLIYAIRYENFVITQEDNNFKSCIDLFEKSEREGVIEGCVNYLFWILLLASGETSDEKKKLLDQYDSKIWAKIQILKNSSLGADLGDYYLALRYLIDFVAENFNNSSTGLRMMEAFLFVGNPYVYEYIRHIIPYIQK